MESGTVGVDVTDAAMAHARRAKVALDAALGLALKGNNETARDAHLRIAEIEADLARTSVLSQFVQAFKDKKFV